MARMDSLSIWSQTFMTYSPRDLLNTPFCFNSSARMLIESRSWLGMKKRNSLSFRIASTERCCNPLTSSSVLRRPSVFKCFIVAWIGAFNHFENTAKCTTTVFSQGVDNTIKGRQMPAQTGLVPCYRFICQCAEITIFSTDMMYAQTIWVVCNE